ncbi:MAG: multicopper oxidase domain-containing protein [Bryobacterales bacterium]|nr:multicopper oxidase domain-containing protein [Bryobacterales bacterium]
MNWPRAPASWRWIWKPNRRGSTSLGRTGYLFGFNGQVPGPIIEAHPGDHVRIRFRNSLPEMTNLHYHGLHVTPNGNGDNSFLEVGSGESLTYEFDLPTSHPGGTFWYHPTCTSPSRARYRAGWRSLHRARRVGPDPGDCRRAGSGPRLAGLRPGQQRASSGTQPDGANDRSSGQLGHRQWSNQPSVRIQRDGWVRLRILNASSSRFYRLRLEEHPLT